MYWNPSLLPEAESDVWLNLFPMRESQPAGIMVCIAGKTSADWHNRSRLSFCLVCRLANRWGSLVFQLSVSQWPLLGTKETEISSALENLNGSVTFALNYSLYDRISDGNGVQKISAYCDYVTIICQVVIWLERVMLFQPQNNFLLVRNNVYF